MEKTPWVWICPPSISYHYPRKSWSFPSPPQAKTSLWETVSHQFKHSRRKNTKNYYVLSPPWGPWWRLRLYARCMGFQLPPGQPLYFGLQPTLCHWPSCVYRLLQMPVGREAQPKPCLKHGRKRQASASESLQGEGACLQKGSCCSRRSWSEWESDGN